MRWPGTKMASHLTIRNVTPIALDLKVIERYTGFLGGSNPIHAIGHMASNVTTMVGMNFTSGPSAAKIAENAQHFAHEETSIRIQPFDLVTTEKSITDRGVNDVLRLTFDAEGQRYRVDVPVPERHSNVLTPLVPDPQFRFTAVYVPDDSFLAIYSSANLDSWMAEMQDDTTLSALSIPGTHNSPTCYRALPSVRCQAVTPREQLDNGVRFFDVRVQPEHPTDASKDGLILVHGVFPISMTGSKSFRALVNDVHAFLAAHPSETVVMSVKREGSGPHTDAHLAALLRTHYARDPDRWWTTPRIPRLAEARGKIVLLRRFVLDHGQRTDWAVDGTGWAYNTPRDECRHVVVQDLCEVLHAPDIDRKIQAATEFLTRVGGAEAAADGASNHLPRFQLNFLSASNFWRVGCWPERIAMKLNPAVVRHLVVRHGVEVPGADWSTGVVVCDWVGDRGDWDLVRCIVGMNSKLLVRQREMAS
jgi:1-phosphatidylinositol phosphodiesterase